MTAIDQSIVDPTNEQVQCDTPLPLCHIFFCFVIDQRAGFPQFPTFFVSLSNIISQYDAYLPLSLTLTLTGK